MEREFKEKMFLDSSSRLQELQLQIYKERQQEQQEKQRLEIKIANLEKNQQKL
jgi:hypothetical protein